LRLAVRYLSQGYYAARAAQLDRLVFPDGVIIDLPAGANPGTVALYALFARLMPLEDWQAALSGPAGFIAFYAAYFGDPWQRAVEPLLPADLAQPQLELPFEVGETWAFTGGPHIDWGLGSPSGAIDLAPIAGTGCKAAPQQALAAAEGVVVRSAHGVLALDLDGDGNEQTGWVLIYLHLSDRLPVGTQVQAGDALGHPSCEGGEASGAHVHLARKYNGEWLGLDRVPFVLSGWQVEAGEKAYQGRMVRGDQVVTASSSGMSGSSIIR
jgi:murein DD-endopeptidase MepM/ murein hydrolase activator NlpD